MVSILLYLLIFVLWSNTLFILENLPYALENNVYSVVVRWSLLYISVRYIQVIVFYEFSISLLIFCLLVISITKSVVFNSPFIISSFSLVQFG